MTFLDNLQIYKVSTFSNIDELVYHIVLRGYLKTKIFPSNKETRLNYNLYQISDIFRACYFEYSEMCDVQGGPINTELDTFY